MKKLLILGGSRYAIPVIETAHRMGLYVITADYLPDNIAHSYSDNYVNVSIIEKDAVLAIATKLQIDGIISFACDPGVVTASYVAEKMGLPFQGSYMSTCILQDKGLFRKFLADNGFNVPFAKSYSNTTDPWFDIDKYKWPVIVKPVDSAGSKGVKKVNTPDKLAEAIEIALRFSHSGKYIIEEFITFEGYHSSADVLTVNGDLVFSTYSDQLFDKDAENPYTPAQIIWPTSMKKNYQVYLDKEIQRLMALLGMRTGMYNIESCVGVDGKPYIMEVSPRGGGCKIAEIQKMAFGIDLIEKEIKASIGLPIDVSDQTECIGYWCEYVIHANPGQTGKFKRMYIDSMIQEKYVKMIDMTVKEGDMVYPFTGANMSLGDMFLCFPSREELNDVMNNPNTWLKIMLED